MAVMITATNPLHINSASPKDARELGAGTPDTANCSVGGMLRGCNGGWCLVRPLPTCQFGFIYGFGFLCRHPEIGQIISRTQARKPARRR
jgi:hypothetical protein